MFMPGCVRCVRRTRAAAFAPFGDMVECKVMMERDDPSRSRGFGETQTNPVHLHMSCILCGKRVTQEESTFRNTVL